MRFHIVIWIFIVSTILQHCSATHNSNVNNNDIILSNFLFSFIKLICYWVNQIFSIERDKLWKKKKFWSENAGVSRIKGIIRKSCNTSVHQVRTRPRSFLPANRAETFNRAEKISFAETIRNFIFIDLFTQLRSPQTCK